MNGRLPLLDEPNPRPSRLIPAVLRLSIPAIPAEVTSVITQYIDAATVGRAVIA